MADRRVTMPTSGAGITRYFEDYRSKIEFKPSHVIILTIAVIAIVMLLHYMGPRILGLA